jgi:hypothetical protein
VIISGDLISRHMELFREIVQSVGKGKFVVMSKKGKRLSKPVSKKAAKKRLQQIEFFKHKGKS